MSAEDRQKRPRRLHSVHRRRTVTPPVSFATSCLHRANQTAVRSLFRNKFPPGPVSLPSWHRAEQFRKRIFVAGRATEGPTRRRRCGFDKLSAVRRTRIETRQTQLERYTRSRDFWGA